MPEVDQPEKNAEFITINQERTELGHFCLFLTAIFDCASFFDNQSSKTEIAQFFPLLVFLGYKIAF